jgi:hypothetical protein
MPVMVPPVFDVLIQRYRALCAAVRSSERIFCGNGRQFFIV